LGVHIFVQTNEHYMLTTTITDFRKDIKNYINKVAENFETLIINRGKDQGVVILSLKEYNSLIATNHELTSRKNEQRLDAAIEKISGGNGVARKLKRK